MLRLRHACGKPAFTYQSQHALLVRHPESRVVQILMRWQQVHTGGRRLGDTRFSCTLDVFPAHQQHASSICRPETDSEAPGESSDSSCEHFDPAAPLPCRGRPEWSTESPTAKRTTKTVFLSNPTPTVAEAGVVQPHTSLLV